MATQSADVGVLTVIRPECHAALRALRIPLRSPDHRIKEQNGTIYWLGRVRSMLLRRDYTIVVGMVGRAGNPSCASAATELIHRWNPSIVLLMGIAAGVRSRVKIGEVVISAQVWAYEPAEVRREADQSILIPRPDSVPLSHRVEQDICAYDEDPNRILRIFSKRVGGRFPVPPEGKQDEYSRDVAASVSIRFGAVASGEKLLRDPQKLRVIRSTQHGKVEAGEMEAAGLVEACRRAELPWLVVRGISDFGDEFKDDSFHTFAASMAAATLADFVSNGLALPSTKAVSGSLSGEVLAAQHTRPAEQLPVQMNVLQVLEHARRRCSDRNVPFRTSHWLLALLQLPASWTEFTLNEVNPDIAARLIRDLVAQIDQHEEPGQAYISLEWSSHAYIQRARVFAAAENCPTVLERHILRAIIESDPLPNTILWLRTRYLTHAFDVWCDKVRHLPKTTSTPIDTA